MKTKIFKVLAISMVLAAVMVGVLAGTAFAAGPQGGSAGNSQGQVGGPSVDAVAKLLGLTPEQIQAERQAGKSLVQIAAAQNVTEDALVQAVMAERQAALQAKVDAGTITQAVADQQLAQMRERVTVMLNRTVTCHPEWAGRGGSGQFNNGSGQGMKQGGLRGNQQNCTGTPGDCTGVGNMYKGGRGAR
jgi:hypothetical protein